MASAMNLKEFTLAVDQAAQNMDQGQLQLLIHSIARKIPEENRKYFMELLKTVQGSSTAECSGGKLKIDIKKADGIEIKRDMERLKKLFHKIEDEEICLQADGYEDYSMGYGGDNWVWEYEETDEIKKVFEDSGRLLIRCVNDGFYHEAVELFDIMMEAEVTVENDWDPFTMGLEELLDEGLITVNLENLALHVLFAVYQKAAPEERARVLYDYFSISFFKNINLENMLSLGKEELKDLPQFWEAWIALLSETPGDTAQRLLEEAVIYQHGEDGLLAAARLACENHPSLYLRTLQALEQLHDSEKLLEIGKEALEKVNKKYVVRSEIALKTGEAAIDLGGEEDAKVYWLEAFRSNPSPVNCLRLMITTQTQDNCRKAMKEIIDQPHSYSGREYNSVKELAENLVTADHKNILRFLNGDFDFVMNQCRQIKVSLGWSSTFMKCGISLLLLLLLKDDDLKQGCKKLAEAVRCYMNFDAETYFKGTGHAREYGKNRTVFPNEQKIFWQCFRQWKTEFSVTDEQAALYLADLETIIDKRVRAIISGQHRAHYGSVAVLAAALGEVKESRGEASAKEAVLRKYWEAFPRHSAFHAELRENGMKDMRKKKTR